MIDFAETLYEIWWIFDDTEDVFDDSDYDVVVSEIWSLDIAKERLFNLQQTKFEFTGHYAIIRVESRYEELK